jgi:hypothetical protein
MRFGILVSLTHDLLTGSTDNRMCVRFERYVQHGTEDGKRFL